jgi:hypothetical protein
MCASIKRTSRLNQIREIFLWTIVFVMLKLAVPTVTSFKR